MSDSVVNRMVADFPGAHLDDLVLEVGTRRLAAVNRAGLRHQLEWLLQSGLSEAEIRRALAEGAGGHPDDPDWTVPSVRAGRVDALPRKEPAAPQNHRNAAPLGNSGRRRHADPPPAASSRNDPAAILARYRT